jgi:hypothetical protein
MSAFGGKADIERNPSECLLMTQSGHSLEAIGYPDQARATGWIGRI